MTDTTKKGYLVQTVLPSWKVYNALVMEARKRMMTVAALLRQIIVEHLAKKAS